jgi:hypothetical protein
MGLAFTTLESRYLSVFKQMEQLFSLAIGHQLPKLMTYLPPQKQTFTIEGQLTPSGPGGVKTQERPPETDSKLGEFSVEVSCLITWRYRLVGKSIASHVVFEGDFWGEIVTEF